MTRGTKLRIEMFALVQGVVGGGGCQIDNCRRAWKLWGNNNNHQRHSVQGPSLLAWSCALFSRQGWNFPWRIPDDAREVFACLLCLFWVVEKKYKSNCIRLSCQAEKRETRTCVVEKGTRTLLVSPDEQMGEIVRIYVEKIWALFHDEPRREKLVIRSLSG